jgi:SAM-dependent methyltransferase
MESKMLKAHEERALDAGMAVRYSEQTQDQAYREGAYDFAEGLHMAPRMGVFAGYIRHLGLNRILDVGCGTGLLLGQLDRQATYVGIDISPTAIDTATRNHTAWPNASFHAATFREWVAPKKEFDCLVWAGIGRTWTRDGRKGRFEDWLDILDRAEPWLAPGAIIILEMVMPHWGSLAPLIEGRYTPIASCDLDFGIDDHRAVRAVRVFRRARS